MPSVGPIQFMDMVELDSIANQEATWLRRRIDPNWRSHKRIRDKVEQGDLGVKTGKGFYQYPDANADVFWEEINGDIIKTLKARVLEKNSLFVVTLPCSWLPEGAGGQS